MSRPTSMEDAGGWFRPVFALVAEESAHVPVSLTSLVGRDRELAAARVMLERPDIRLVTLTGPGGIGKTRLALQLAIDLKPMFPDGVRFVPLEFVRDPGMVSLQIAQAVNVHPREDEPALDAVVRTIRSATMLLVVDNIEHLVVASDVLTSLLATCPHLKILVTSRVLLRVTGEHTLTIPPLELPTSEADLVHEDVAECGAIQLFAQRARAADDSFELTSNALPWVAEICRRLEGIPLAIELVAPRVRHLALPDLLARLDRRLPLLTGGARDQPARFQTMRSTIAWGHDLLAPAVQQVFRRLGVFTGGFTLAAAEWVMGEGAVDDRDRRLAIFEQIGSLVDASLLTTVSAPDGSGRYRMLETIREFAVEQLAASDEAEEVRRSHAGWCVAFAERHEFAPLLDNAAGGNTLLEVEYPNLRQVLEWLEETGDHEQLLRLATCLGMFWSDHGQYREGHRWLSRALAVEGVSRPDRARDLVAIGMLEMFLGMNREAEANLGAGLAGCREFGHAFDAGRALMGLGSLAISQGDLARGIECFEECLAVSQQVPDLRLARVVDAWGLINLAMVARLQGDGERAERQLTCALAATREASYAPGLPLVLGDLGDVIRDRGDHGRALEFYREALGLSWGHRGQRVTADLIESVAIVMITLGEVEAGVQLLGAAEALRERVGLQFRIVSNQAARDQAIAKAEVVLGEEAFVTAWKVGRALESSDVMMLAVTPFDLRPGARSRKSPVPALTPREAEIAHLVAAGHTDAGIAEMLFISVRTVENHVAHLLVKLGIHTRTAVGEALGLAPTSMPSRPARGGRSRTSRTKGK